MVLAAILGDYRIIRLQIGGVKKMEHCDRRMRTAMDTVKKQHCKCIEYKYSVKTDINEKQLGRKSFMGWEASIFVLPYVRIGR
uniref:Ovule protein n=1 Tax=Heterorhabditis bacteriophora TaxID=37862 RepID=A0A1I7XVC3_HETBA